MRAAARRQLRCSLPAAAQLAGGREPELLVAYGDQSAQHACVDERATAVLQPACGREPERGDQRAQHACVDEPATAVLQPAGGREPELVACGDQSAQHACVDERATAVLQPAGGREMPCRQTQLVPPSPLHHRPLKAGHVAEVAPRAKDARARRRHGHGSGARELHQATCWSSWPGWANRRGRATARRQRPRRLRLDVDVPEVTREARRVNGLQLQREEKLVADAELQRGEIDPHSLRQAVELPHREDERPLGRSPDRTPQSREDGMLVVLVESGPGHGGDVARGRCGVLRALCPARGKGEPIRYFFGGVSRKSKG